MPRDDAIAATSQRCAAPQRCSGDAAATYEHRHTTEQCGSIPWMHDSRRRHRGSDTALPGHRQLPPGLYLVPNKGAIHNSGLGGGV